MTTVEMTSIAACSLDRDGIARRATDFRALLAPNLRDLRRTGTGAELDLALDAVDERALAGLLELERECCPFLRFALTRRSARLVSLTVSADAPHEDALEGFLTLTRPERVPTREAFRAGEAARRAGVGVETLRYYERRGLLPTPRRRPSGQREYTLEDIRLVRAFKMSQQLGFTLAETQEIIRMTQRRGGRDSAGLREQVQAKLREVDDKIRGLELARAQLQAVIAAECDGLVDCGCGDDCPIDIAEPEKARRLQVIR